MSVPTPGGIAEDKAALRRRFRRYRRQLSEEAYAEKSAAITEHLEALPELREARTVHTYWPLTQHHEVDTRPLIRWLHHHEKRIVLPVVQNFGASHEAAPRMHHVYYEESDMLLQNRWGIHEPSSGQTVPLEEIDAVIVPALGAGRNGHRIGHGHGFYDEFLGALPEAVPRICLVYAHCLVEAVPFTDEDVPLTMIVTESSVVRLRNFNPARS